MKLLCTGDLHLGAGAELGRAPGDRLLDQSHVLGEIAAIAEVRRVDGILIAGDVFEGPGIPPEQLQLFAQFVAACHIAEIPILAIVGNGKHDAAVRATNGLAIFSHIPGIEIAARPDIYKFAGCVVATLPWVHPGKLIAQHGRDVGRDEINATVGQLLVDIAAELKTGCDTGFPDVPHILLGHWSVEGSALPNGLPVADLREPVIPIAELDQLGFGHIVLGHIHRAQEVGERGFYVGSPLPLNFGETHVSHGIYILHTDERESIDAYAAEYIEIESRPLRDLSVDITGDDQTSGLAYVDVGLMWNELAEDGAIVRAKIRATSDQWKRVDVAAIRRGLLESGAHSVKVVPDIVRADRARVEGVDENLAPLQALDLWLDANGLSDTADSWVVDRMRAKTTEYLEAAA